MFIGLWAKRPLLESLLQSWGLGRETAGPLLTLLMMVY